MMLGVPEKGIDPQPYVLRAHFSDVVTRDFALSVGLRFAENVAPVPVHLDKRSLLPQLSLGRLLGVFAGLDQALWKIPVAIRPKNQIQRLSMEINWHEACGKNSSLHGPLNCKIRPIGAFE
jgi:hypothetical protein